jgi:gas vesicle protein
MLPAIGLLGAGAAAGAVCALLFAPKSGAETRARLEEKARDAKGRFDEKLRHTQEMLDEAGHRLRTPFEERPGVGNGGGV